MMTGFPENLLRSDWQTSRKHWEPKGMLDWWIIHWRVIEFELERTNLDWLSLHKEFKKYESRLISNV